MIGHFNPDIDLFMPAFPWMRETVTLLISHDQPLVRPTHLSFFNGNFCVAAPVVVQQFEVLTAAT